MNTCLQMHTFTQGYGHILYTCKELYFLGIHTFSHNNLVQAREMTRDQFLLMVGKSLCRAMWCGLLTGQVNYHVFLPEVFNLRELLHLRDLVSRFGLGAVYRPFAYFPNEHL